MKYIHILFASLYININHCLAIDELITFKNAQQSIIKGNHIDVVYRAGEEVLGKCGQSSRDKTELIRKMEQKLISTPWLEWFKRRFKNFESISYKQFAAAIFYPFEYVESSPKLHINQMNYAFKACIYYSSRLDPHGIGREVVESLSNRRNWDLSNSDEQLSSYIDNTFVSNNAIFVERALDYLSRDNNDQRLFVKLQREGSGTQLFNFGLLLKKSMNEELAKHSFREASRKGYFRAAIESAYIDMQNDHATGIDSLTNLGAYGLWKIAQCFRYGRLLDQNLGESNKYYLLALQEDCTNFPEIIYDAGDFVANCAFSQRDPKIFKKVITKAMNYFNGAAVFRLSSAHIRMAELIEQVVRLQPHFKDLPEFSEAILTRALFQSSIEGSYKKAKAFMIKKRQDPQHLLTSSSVEIIEFIKQIDATFDE